jgi:hypothetical protein
MEDATTGKRQMHMQQITLPQLVINAAGRIGFTLLRRFVAVC